MQGFNLLYLLGVAVNCAFTFDSCKGDLKFCKTWQ